MELSTGQTVRITTRGGFVHEGTLLNDFETNLIGGGHSVTLKDVRTYYPAKDCRREELENSRMMQIFAPHIVSIGKV